MVQMRQSLPKKACLMRLGGGRHHDFTPSECISRGQSLYTGWWFGWLFIFAYSGIFTIPTDFHVHIFQRVAQPPTSISSCYYICFHPLLPTRNWWGFIGHWKFSAFSWHWVSRIVGARWWMRSAAKAVMTTMSGRVASAKRNDPCLSIWRFPKRGGDPQVTMGFNTKSWSTMV